MLSNVLLTILAVFAAHAVYAQDVPVLAATDVLSFVDALIGTANGGHVFAGATLPYSMAKAVADVDGDNEAGFAADNSNVTGYSHMHDSGTGGAASMGQFPIFPQVCGPGIDNCLFPRDDRKVAYVNKSVTTEPGYFSIQQVNGIQADMTVTNHTALYRFTFPSSAPTGESPLILVDLIDLPETRMNASVAVDPTSGQLTGTGTFNPSFGIGMYDLHFCADFRGAAIRDTGIFVNNRGGNSTKSFSIVPDGVDSGSTLVPAGAWVWFDNPTSNQILARVGVSFISIDQACSNAQTEIPSFDFRSVRLAGRQTWRDKLNVVSINATGVSTALQKVFWSGLYRAMISPQDYTGENPLWTSSEPYYDSFYCGWDAFRAQMPLLNIVDPLVSSRMMRALIDIWRHEGWLPDCRMSLCKGFTQGGSNADNILVDAYLKNITGPNWADAYSAIVNDAENEPNLWSVQGRGGLASWKSLNYIPTDDFDVSSGGPFTRSISRTVEYAYNDFCISELALALGNTADYEKYSARSSNWKNMFNANTASDGYVGFLEPRYLNGSFGFQDPVVCSGLWNLSVSNCYLNANGQETYEGSTWLYTFFAPGDMASLVTTLGGPNTFVSRLQYLHSSGLLYMGDEQSFLPVYLYHYASRPALSSLQRHTYIPSLFNTSNNGLPGNDDSGAMGSFVFLSMLGLFPNPGQNVYLITPPFFPSVSVRNEQTGNTATVTCVGFDATYRNVYVQSATLDGVNYTRNWIDHGFFLDGGVLELMLGPVESAWGTQQADLPPSLSTTGVYLR